jgi:hypothetical protein
MSLRLVLEWLGDTSLQAEQRVDYSLKWLLYHHPDQINRESKHPCYFPSKNKNQDGAAKKRKFSLLSHRKKRACVNVCMSDAFDNDRSGKKSGVLRRTACVGIGTNRLKGTFCTPPAERRISCFEPAPAPRRDLFGKFYHIR